MAVNGKILYVNFFPNLRANNPNQHTAAVAIQKLYYKVKPSIQTTQASQFLPQTTSRGSDTR